MIFRARLSVSDTFELAIYSFLNVRFSISLLLIIETLNKLEESKMEIDIRDRYHFYMEGINIFPLFLVLTKFLKFFRINRIYFAGLFVLFKEIELHDPSNQVLIQNWNIFQHTFKPMEHFPLIGHFKEFLMDKKNQVSIYKFCCMSRKLLLNNALKGWISLHLYENI